MNYIHNNMSQQIVHNSGVNYSLYYNVVNYFKTIMSNHPSIAAVTFGDAWDIGERQFPEYPIGNILILESDFGTNVTNYKVQIIIADKQKNKNNESTGVRNEETIPLYGVDDRVDIWANTLAIINDLTSYTQRGVAGFEINDDIVCTPFSERFDNGLAGWTAEFTLTAHNDRNRCLFYLVSPSGSGYIIEDCDSGKQYRATLNGSGSVGQVFATKTQPNSSKDITTYYDYKCYTIVGTFTGSDEYNFVNLPIIALPYTDFENCEVCGLWTNPQVWGTTPQNWSSGSAVAYRQWQFD